MYDRELLLILCLNCWIGSWARNTALFIDVLVKSPPLYINQRNVWDLELKELVVLHGDLEEGPLTKEEVAIIKGALDLEHKTAATVMTEVFSPVATIP